MGNTVEADPSQDDTAAQIRIGQYRSFSAVEVRLNVPLPKGQRLESVGLAGAMYRAARLDAENYLSAYPELRAARQRAAVSPFRYSPRVGKVVCLSLYLTRCKSADSLT